MMDRKWTPGPWVVDAIGSYYQSVSTKAEGLKDRRTYGYGCGIDFICDLNDGEYHEYSDLDEQAANAHLIAAAPELYEALERLSDLICDLEKFDETGHVLKAINASDQALAKARGETQ